MARILIVYASKNGQTKKISCFLANELKDRGHQVELVNSDDAEANVNLTSCEGVIVGGPVYIGSFPRPLRTWVQNHQPFLEKKKTAFFSVCLGILQKDSKVQKDERRIVENFFAETQWHPALWTVFAGALNYSRYNWLIKLLMRRISRKAGGDTNIAQDYEYTNWQDVRSFAEKFIQQEAHL